MAGAWPRHGGDPLCLVAQLDLAAMRAAGGPDWLPSQGRLLFFYGLEHGAWGHDPSDVGSFLVRHETGVAGPAVEPPDLIEEARFPAYPVWFAPAVSFPDADRMGIDWRRLAAEDQAALEAALEALEPAEPAHQVGGYPSPIQSDTMEEESHQLTRGLFRGSAKDRKSEQPGEAADWRLLLQLDTDDAAGMMWGDTGRLYFWVREQDARVNDFSKSWMILQCC